MVVPVPLQLSAHSAWECQNVAHARDVIGDSLDEPGPARFLQQTRHYAHTGWVQTAMLPEPRLALPMHVGPDEVQWQTEGAECSFAGDCFGVVSFLHPSGQKRPGQGGP